MVSRAGQNRPSKKNEMTTSPNDSEIHGGSSRIVKVGSLPGFSSPLNGCKFLPAQNSYRDSSPRVEKAAAARLLRIFANVG